MTGRHPDVIIMASSLNPMSAPGQNAHGAGSILRISGPFLIEQLESLRLQFLPLFDRDDPVVFDLSAVDACDSGGVQLLCSASASARASGRSLQIQDPSAAVIQAGAAIGVSISSLNTQPKNKESHG